MRTTLTLDKDVAVQLERIQRDRQTTFKEVVNEAIRHGLQHMTRTPHRRPRYRTRTVSLGRCLIGSLDDV
ncbi:MAG: hypothetical protein Q7R41_07900, partial [Phycisphaerales bacterium]|nr:hypothetical protein [Phycisphaerales bacterium]